MTKQQIQAKKEYLIQTVNAKDVLVRYGVRINNNRCKGFCHNGKDLNVKVFGNGTQCFVCNKSMDIFDIVQHFENCNFWTAFKILGGTDDIDEKTERIMREARKKRELEVLAEKKRKEEVAKIIKMSNEYKRLLENCYPLSNDWCYYYKEWQYWMRLYENKTKGD